MREETSTHCRSNRRLTPAFYKIKPTPLPYATREVWTETGDPQ
jgi:hypothetical protein